MKNKIVLIPIIITAILIGTIPLHFLYSRYMKNKVVMGNYIRVDDSSEEKLQISLKKWTLGEKEKLECDLWNCTGYKKGHYKIVDKNKIRFYYDRIRYISYEFEIEEDDGYYLILRDGNYTEIYKKIK